MGDTGSMGRWLHTGAGESLAASQRSVMARKRPTTRKGSHRGEVKPTDGGTSSGVFTRERSRRQRDPIDGWRRSIVCSKNLAKRCARVWRRCGWKESA
jgi:hypothetical protein